MDIRVYSSFVTTAELMNMTAAAQRLNMTQSALSRQITGLEAHLGVKLFEKSGRNIRLTGEGELLMAKAQALLAAERELRLQADGLSQGDTGVLRLGACSQLIERYFPDFLRGWRDQNPGVDLRIEDAGGAELIEKLKGGQVHCTVSAAPAQPVETFGLRRIGSLGYLAVAAPGFFDRPGQPIEASDLFDKPLLMLNRKHASREVFDAVMRVYGARPEIIVESYSPHTLFSLAEGGNGVAIVPSSARISSASLMRRPIMLKGEPVRFDISAMWNTQLPPPAFAQRFIDALAAHIAREEEKEARQPFRRGALYSV
ncbi:DNA-binding transcriptional LysR family regulator [Rhizobium sp. SG_E_25_P2]|jgi:DNA-binding transcriptional LysR family regulator|uniref:LysR family transcriptional regulator n=1 Tax=Rhizobium sp. SG_E_25_P2 TaxID=2879942 RepID=UPI002473E280|nr:LysR family transcriptional regulator [Rhizobium sp. SG_E_25_P2]MDH6265421.1 DNA-binding transcriptional LysR family regulator [Rhizobium sp. SG_E_25_P2]